MPFVFSFKIIIFLIFQDIVIEYLEVSWILCIYTSRELNLKMTYVWGCLLAYW